MLATVLCATVSQSYNPLGNFIFGKRSVDFIEGMGKVSMNEPKREKNTHSYRDFKCVYITI